LRVWGLERVGAGAVDHVDEEKRIVNDLFRPIMREFSAQFHGVGMELRNKRCGGGLTLVKLANTIEAFAQESILPKFISQIWHEGGDSGK